MVGGQLEVQNASEGYLYRGEISAAKLREEGDSLELVVGFSWFAKMESDSGWSVAEPEPYTISLLIYSVSDIGQGRISLSSSITGEQATIFPPDGSKLDPSKVRGFVLA